jgi:hypothetical protein
MIVRASAQRPEIFTVRLLDGQVIFVSSSQRERSMAARIVEAAICSAADLFFIARDRMSPPASRPRKAQARSSRSGLGTRLNPSAIAWKDLMP